MKVIIFFLHFGFGYTPKLRLARHFVFLLDRFRPRGQRITDSIEGLDFLLKNFEVLSHGAAWQTHEVYDFTFAEESRASPIQRFHRHYALGQWLAILPGLVVLIRKPDSAFVATF